MLFVCLPLPDQGTKSPGTWLKKELPSRCLLSKDKGLIPGSCQESQFMGPCQPPVTGHSHLLLLVT